MTRVYRVLFILILVPLTAGFISAQGKIPGLGGPTFKPGLSVEYNPRTIEWDEETSSAMKSLLVLFNAEVELQDGFSVAALAGYSMSNFESLVFRELPISVDLEVGNIGGIVLGAEAEKSLFFWRDFTVFGKGRFLSYFGSESSWTIPGLNVEGSLTGKTNWMQGQIGPMVVYEGFSGFRPYAYIQYNRLWGTFQLEENVLELTGTEEKTISGKSVIGTGIGADYSLTDALNLKAEAAVMPYSGGVDWNLFIKFQYSFQF